MPGSIGFRPVAVQLHDVGGYPNPNMSPRRERYRASPGERPSIMHRINFATRRHLSFGAGIHRCVGDRIAEQQLRILWEEILERDLRIEIAGPPQRIYSNFIREFHALPARIVN